MTFTSAPTAHTRVGLVVARLAAVVTPFFGGALVFEEGRMGVDQLFMVRPVPGGRSGLPAVCDF